MSSLVRAVTLMILAVGCTSKLPRQSDLDRPRILAIELDRPTLRPGEMAQGQILLYDPFWRKPTIHWALSLNPLSLDQLRTDYPDPATLTPDLGFLYLGQGSRVVTPPYPLNTSAEAALAEAGVELFSLPLVAFVDIAGHPERLIGFKQLRLQVTAASLGFLEQGDGWSDLTAAEQRLRLAERIELVYNRNPVVGSAQIATRDGGLSVEDRNDLAKRKALEFDPQSLSVEPGGIVRASLPLTDPDNTLNGRELVRDQEGFNVLQSTVFMELAQRTPVDPFTADFGMDILEQDSAASEPKFDPMPAGIYVGHMVGIDRRGGVRWRSYSVDAASEPPEQLQTAGSAVLLRSGGAVFWQPVTEAMVSALVDATAPVVLSGILARRSLESEVSLADDARRSAGSPFVIESPALVTDPRQVEMADAWLNLATLYEHLGRPVTAVVDLVRVWP